MYKKFPIFLFILLLIPIYAENVSGIVSCHFIPPNSDLSSCFLMLYRMDNSHVALCNNTAPYLQKYGCLINVTTTVNNQVKNYTIPIKFTWINCQNPILYIYKDKNSHVSLSSVPNSYSVCFDQNFSKVLNISNSSGTFLIGLYNITNSHVSINNTSLSYRLFINVTDKVFPNVIYNNTKDYIILPAYINVSFSDNLFLYYCEIYINNKPIYLSDHCRYSSYYSYTFSINESDCPKNQCNITYVAVDLAGNLYKLVKSYTVLNPCLEISLDGGLSSLILVGFEPRFLDIKLRIPPLCTGNFTNSTLIIDGTDCTGIILINGRTKLSYSVSNLPYTTSVRIDPLRTGRCNLRIVFNGTIKDLEENIVYTTTIPVSVSIRTALGFLIVSEPTIIIAVVLILILLLLL